MNRIDDAVYKSVTDDIYKLYPYGGSHVDHYAILGAAHIIADALDKLTEQMVIFNKNAEQYANPVYTCKPPPDITWLTGPISGSEPSTYVTRYDNEHDS